MKLKGIEVEVQPFFEAVKTSSSDIQEMRHYNIVSLQQIFD